MSEDSDCKDINVVSCKKIRSTNYSNDEKIILLNIIAKYKHIIENKKTDGVSVEKKNAYWAKIANEFNSISPNNVVRDVNSLKKFFANQKKEARKCAAEERFNLNKTGGGPPSAKKPEALQEITLSIMNEKSVFGLQNPFDSDSNVVPFPLPPDINEDIIIEYIPSTSTSTLASTSTSTLPSTVTEHRIVSPPKEAVPANSVDATIPKPVTQQRAFGKKRIRPTPKVRPMTTSHLAEKYNQLLDERLEIAKLTKKKLNEEIKANQEEFEMKRQQFQDELEMRRITNNLNKEILETTLKIKEEELRILKTK